MVNGTVSGRINQKNGQKELKILSDLKNRKKKTGYFGWILMILSGHMNVFMFV